MILVAFTWVVFWALASTLLCVIGCLLTWWLQGSVAATDAKISFTPDAPAGPVAKPAAAEPTFANLYIGAVEGSDLKVTLKTEKVLVFKKKG